MHSSSLLRIVVTSVILAVSAAGQSYNATGILRSVDGSLIPHGHLTASLANAASDDSTSYYGNITAEADERGHFVVPLQGPGRWKLIASSRGFQTSALDEHDGFYTGVIVTATRPSIEVNLRLTPDASIDGYVLDEVGEAVRSAAQITLLMAKEPDSAEEKTSWHTRGSTRPDDRGHFEFSGLAPGHYQVMVQAQPWYAAGSFRQSAQIRGESATPQADSPLDVVYPLTWFPGVTDADAAGVLTLRGGDTQQADLRLLPVPAIHLHIATATNEDSQRNYTNVPQLRLLTPNGASRFQAGRSSSITSDGTDIGGLAPGTYEVTGAGGERQSVLHIDPGSPRLVDLNFAVLTTPLSIHCDVPEGVPVPEMRFTDAETGQITPPQNGWSESLRGGLLSSEFPFAGEDQQRGIARSRVHQGLHQRGDQTIDLMPGRYELSVSGDHGQYLLGVTATGAETTGKTVTVHGGTPKLMVHIGTSHALLSGLVMLREHPVAGAMLLLVPTTLGDPQSLATLRREQSNTDGTFQLTGIIPGRYILVAIDHGWGVNWHDMATLSHYLIHGVPIDLTAAQSLRQGIEAQLP